MAAQAHRQIKFVSDAAQDEAITREAYKRGITRGAVLRGLISEKLGEPDRIKAQRPRGGEGLMAYNRRRAAEVAERNAARAEEA